MKTLIVEDDFTCSLLLEEILSEYGAVQTTVNGQEAVEAVRLAIETKQPYNLICMDIMMPGMGGQQALKEIRKLEKINGIPSIKAAKIIMTSALDDIQNKLNAFSGLCDDYIVKPIDKERLLYVISKMRLIP
jgi:two-component system, chemotaxis family, chemotaxis protein CheY